MAAPDDDGELRQRIARMERLLHDVDQFPDLAVRTKMREIVQTVMDMHGSALGRIFRAMAEIGPTGRQLVNDLSRDEQVGSLLALYNLHPHDLEERVREALNGVRPALHAHGGSVELLAVAEGTVRLRLMGGGFACASTAAALRQRLEEAIYSRAPDVVGIEAESAIDEFIPPSPDRKLALPLIKG